MHFSSGFDSHPRTALVLSATLLFAVPGDAVDRNPSQARSPAPEVADRDLDGVPDDRDNCPNLPNEPQKGGKQALICGAAFRAAVDRHVFLGSRTFRPPQGLDTRIELTGRPVHVLLHIKQDDDPVVLLKGQRGQLLATGVKLWGYVPHYTYFATVPGTRAEMASILALPFVRGMSALQARDRVSRAVRRARGAEERQPDGTLQYAVEFYPDVSPPQVAKVLDATGVELIAEDEAERI